MKRLFLTIASFRLLKPAPRLDQESAGAWSLLTAPTQSWLRTIVCAAVLFLVQWPVSPDSHIDLAPTVVAARLASTGHWGEIYPAPGTDPAAWFNAANELALDVRVAGPFTCHPYYLAVATKLVEGVPYPKIKDAFIALNRVGIALIALEMAQLLGLFSVGAQLLLTLFLASCSPVISNLHFGQNSLLALTFALGALLVWARSQGVLSLVIGVLLAICACSCKPWCVLLLPVLFLLRDVRSAVLGSLTTLFAVMVLPFFLFDRALIVQYRLFLDELRRITIPGFLNLSTTAAIHRLRSDDWLSNIESWANFRPSATVAGLAAAFAGTAFLLSVIALFVRRPAVSWLLAASLGLILVPLGVAWTHYFVFALPVAILGSAGNHDSRLLRFSALGLLAQLVLLEHWLRYDYQRSSPYPLALPIVSVALVSVLMLWLCPLRAGTTRVEAETTA